MCLIQVDLDELALQRKKEREAREAEKLKNAKSIVVLDVKPYDSETDLKGIEAEVRKITIEGLTWGKGQLADVAYGIQVRNVSIFLVIYWCDFDNEDIFLSSPR